MIADISGGVKRIADIEAAVTSTIPSGTAIVGDWTGLIVGLHSGLDLIVDNSTGSAAGALRIVGLQAVSIGVADEDRFAYSDDVGTPAPATPPENP